MASSSTVLFFTGSLGAGGLERFVTKVSIIAKRDHVFNPVVVCLDRRSGLFLSKLERSNIPVLQAPPAWQRNPFALLRLGRLIRIQKPSVVHSQVNFSLLQQSLVVSLFSSAKLMVTERNCYPLSGWALFKRRVQFHLLRRFGVRFSANSVDVARHISRLMKIPVHEVPVIPNGMELVVADKAVRQQVRSRHGWGANDFVVGYVARFASQKGHRYFVRVMHELYSELGGRLKVCFVGDGPLKDVISKEVSRTPLAQLVTFTGIIENVQEYYHAFDCAALLSDFEGMPNVVIEAMANGLPVIANPVGNVTELFQGGAGIVNISKEPRETAALFCNLAKDVDLRQRVGVSASNRIRSSFSIENTVKLLVGYYASKS